MQEWRELMEERGTRTGQADEAAGRRLGAGQAAAPTTPSSPATAARSPPGGRATSRSQRGQMHSRLGHAGLDGATACPTPSPRRSPIPDRQCVAFVGDGGFSMLMAEFATCVKYQLPVKVVVIKNNTLGHDQVGADGLPRQPGVRLRAAARSTSPRSPAPAAATGFTDRGPGRVRRRPRPGAGHRRARSSSRRWSTRSSRRCRPRSPLEQAAKFAKSLAEGSRTAGRSP